MNDWMNEGNISCFYTETFIFQLGDGYVFERFSRVSEERKLLDTFKK